MPDPIVKACMTAAAVQTQIFEPTMDALTRVHRRVALLHTIQAATRELAQIAEHDEHDLRRALAEVDLAQARLQYAEQRGCYDAVPEDSSALTGKEIARRVRSYLDVLTDTHRRDEHAETRAALHVLFEAQDQDVLSSTVTYQLRQSYRLALTGLFDQWRAARGVPA